MAEAPERLWLWPAEPEDGADKCVSFPGQPYPSGSTEYIRADVARADAQAAVALVVERAAGEAAGEVAAHGSGELSPFLRRRIRALAPADALAEVQRLRVEARENAMQALASMGQAQDAYEAQLEAEAELAAAQQREAALSDPICVHVNMLRGTIAKPTLEQIIHLYGVDALCKALMPVIVREAEAAIIRKGGTL